MGQSLRKQFNRIPFHRAYTSIYWSIATLAFAILPLCMWAQGVHVLAIEAEARKPTADPGIVASVPTHTWANGVFTEQYTNAQPVTNSTRDAHLELPCANDSLNLTPIPPASIEARKHWKHPFRILHGQTKRPGSRAWPFTNRLRSYCFRSSFSITAPASRARNCCPNLQVRSNDTRGDEWEARTS